MPKLLRLDGGQVIDLGPPADLDLPHDADLLANPPSTGGVRTVRLELPKFKDGRAFTQARLLRLRFGFDGEIRVGGHVLPDQALYLRRVGADTVELDDETRLAAFRSALAAYSYSYQRPVGGRSVADLRSAAQ